MDTRIQNEQGLYTKFNYPEAYSKTLKSNNVDINGAKLNTIQKDTVELSNKKVLTKKSKIILAALGLAAAIGIGFLVKKKIDVNSVAKLAENIEFKEAKSLDEAIEFGSKNLGISEYKGFKPEEFDVVNWINESLVDINNKMKGKAVMPDVVEYLDVIEGNENAEASMQALSGILRVSRSKIEKTKSVLCDYCRKHENLPVDEIEEMVKNINSSASYTFSYLDKKLKQNPDILKKANDQFLGNIICHEMGHLQHARKIGFILFNELADYGKKDASSTQAKKLYKLFDSSKGKILDNVTRYATTTPLEFVADTFEGLCCGQKFDKDIMKLYKKFGGVIPA